MKKSASRDPDANTEHTEVIDLDAKNDCFDRQNGSNNGDGDGDSSFGGALIRKAKMYQDYMNSIPIPLQRKSIIPCTSWEGLGNSVKQLYGQPLHYLTNALLRQWDRMRIGSENEFQPLDTIIHPSKAEALIWVTEQVHRISPSHHHLAKLWASDPMFYHTFIDSIDLPKY